MESAAHHLAQAEPAHMITLHEVVLLVVVVVVVVVVAEGDS